MSEAKKHKIPLFVGGDITALTVINNIVPRMVEAGYEPVLYFPEHKPSKKASHPDLVKAAYFERIILNEVIYPFLEKDTKTLTKEFKSRAQCLPPRMLAEKYKLHYEEVPDVNEPAFVERIKNDNSVFLSISVRCFQIFKKDMIEACRSHGNFLNLHPGLLPNYRGVLSVARAMADGQDNYGWTLHHIDEGIDTGRIVDLGAIQLNSHNTALRETMRMACVGSKMLLQNLEKIAEGQTLVGYPQVPKEAKYFSYPTAETLDDWRENGPCLVNPDEMPEVYADHFIKPGTKLGSKLSSALKVATQRAIEEKGYTGNCGTDGRKPAFMDEASARKNKGGTVSALSA